jgi:hypothetical protein
MKTLSNYPDAIRRIHGQGFVDYTITRRLPKILANIEEQIKVGGSLEAVRTMLEAIINEDSIDLRIFAHPTAYWKEYLNNLNGLTWADLPFFDLEFLFYHGLNSIAGYFDKGVDVFCHIRQLALAEAIPVLKFRLERLSEFTGKDLLGRIIFHSLFANEADYSQIVASRSDSKLWNERMLLDESEKLILSLNKVHDEMKIHVIADNAGHELCWDLVMIDAILGLSNTIKIVIHVKPWPMFVSDALSIDVMETINHFFDCNFSEYIRLIGQRLMHAIEYERLCINAESDWGEPRHFSALEESLGNSLRSSTSVISKGDLNYRRFVKDLQWKIDTPPEVASYGVPFQAFALRVLKSDALVGIDSSIASSAAQKFSDWRSCGHFAIIQSL